MISVVMPCYNEEEIVESSYHAVRRVIEGITSDYEILFANDGAVRLTSLDGSEDRACSHLTVTINDIVTIQSAPAGTWH